jgi:predicted PurR-regulated permease PerM
LSGFLTSLPEMVLDIFLFVLSLYFFLRDGARLGPEIQLLSPFSPEETAALFDSVIGTVRSAILGTVAVAFVQGTETLIALLIFDIPGAFLFGLIATFMSLVPLVGTMPVTLGAMTYLFASDRIGASIGMLIAALIIGTSDNIVRPWVQSRGASMHPLMAMLGIFGGIAVMGMAGIFIGPIVSALVVWLLREKRRAIIPV